MAGIIVHAAVGVPASPVKDTADSLRRAVPESGGEEGGEAFAFQLNGGPDCLVKGHFCPGVGDPAVGYGLQPVNKGDDIHHLPFRAFQPLVGGGMAVRAVIPGVVPQGGRGIAVGGGPGGEQFRPSGGVEPGHLILLVKPLPGGVGIELNDIDLARVMEGAAAFGVVQHGSPLFGRVSNGTDKVYLPTRLSELL